MQVLFGQLENYVYSLHRMGKYNYFFLPGFAVTTSSSLRLKMRI